MFYRWFLKFFPKADIYDRFKTWVGEKPANDTYEFHHASACAFAEFLRTTENQPRAYVSVDYYTVKEGNECIAKEFPKKISNALSTLPHTFGALYERLK
jgi:hypothetical protein